MPTRNDATAYSSNDVVNAIRSADTTAGRISGNVISRNVAQPVRAEVVGGLLERLVDLLEPRHEHEDRVRQRDHDVADHDRRDAARDAELVEQEQQRDPEDEVRDHERAQEQRRDDRLAAEEPPRERDRREHAEDDGADARQRRR